MRAIRVMQSLVMLLVSACHSEQTRLFLSWAVFASLRYTSRM